MSDIFTNAVITTERLRLEPFAIAHAQYLNRINNEPQVMQFLTDGTPEAITKTRAAITRVRERWTRLGYGWWAIRLGATDEVIGAACAQNVANEDGAEIEIGWRLATSATGHGFATEAGIAAATYSFDVIGVDHVVAVADPRNTASHNVMKRIGMTYRGLETHYDEICTTYALHKSAFGKELSQGTQTR
jgi:RimJ/RimL family protein N-acetyltransferase